MHRIKAYFSNLPFKFGHAAIATLIISILVTLQNYVSSISSSHLAKIGNINHLIFPSLNYFVWLFLTPAIYMLLLRIFTIPQISNSLIRKNVAVMILSLGFSLIHELVGVLIYNGVYAVTKFDQFFEGVEAGYISMDFLGYTKTCVEFWILFFVIQNFHIKKKARIFQERNTQLESDLLKAQMSALKNQLHPHFLFNAFNAISSLMNENIHLAQRMISKLGALLRKILRDADSPFIAIKEEVELAKLYLEVEQIRFKERLITRFSIDPEAADFMIPTLLLQPLIENSIKHGFYRKTGECEISLKIEKNEDFLNLEVKDNGGGIKNEETFSCGIGLKNVKKRLQGCYGENYKLNVDPRPQGGGFCVSIETLLSESDENINGHN